MKSTTGREPPPTRSSDSATLVWTYNGNYGFDKGSGALDQRQRFVYSFVWAPTFTHSNNAFAKYVVNNWQLSSITTHRRAAVPPAA